MSELSKICLYRYIVIVHVFVAQKLCAHFFVTSQQVLLICDMECSQYPLQVLTEKAGHGWGKCVVRGPGRSDVGLLGMQGSCGTVKSELFLLSLLTMLS